VRESLGVSSLEKLYLPDLGEDDKIQAMICLGTLYFFSLNDNSNPISFIIDHSQLQRKTSR